jgi:hypothetical protein
VKADGGWKRRFDDLPLLPRGRQLVTLQDAGNYITKLHEAQEWQAPTEALMLVATHGGPFCAAPPGIAEGRANDRRMASGGNSCRNLQRNFEPWGPRRF